MVNDDDDDDGKLTHLFVLTAGAVDTAAAGWIILAVVTFLTEIVQE